MPGKTIRGKSTRGVGRPTKYQKRFCIVLKEHFEQGFSFECFGATLAKKFGDKYCVSVQTLYDWQKAHPEFLEARVRWEPLARQFWEDIGRRGAVGQLSTSTDIVAKKTVHDKETKQTVFTYGVVGQKRIPAQFNATAWRLVMQNRFGMKNTVDHDGKIATGEGDAMRKVLENPETAELALQLAEAMAGESD
jgi:hypothetical protein